MTIQMSSQERESDEYDAELSVNLTGFGRFNIKVLILCGLIYMNTGFSISSVGLVMPSAACDFNLTTVDKGRISAVPMLGMFFGGYLWGCFADLRGRKKGLSVALFSHFLFEIISSVVPNYWGYLCLKFLSGFSISGQGVILFSYLGEFQPTKMREKILCWLEMAWSLGLIALPLTGWAIIPLNISFVSDNFFFQSWNLFVAICSLPSLFIGLWLCSFPETPKYLMQAGEDAKWAQVLERMYKENTGKSYAEYLEKVSKSGVDSLNERLLNAKSLAVKTEKLSKTNESMVISRIYKQSIALFKPPYLARTSIVCTTMFCLGSSYYALMLWFPELFKRFGDFEVKYPGESTSVCRISKYSTETNETVAIVNECPTHIQTEVYIHTLILGAACVPLSLILPLFINKLGYKFYLIVSSFIASAVTVGLFFAVSSTQNLILSCIFEAFSSVGMSIVLCMAVDLYPTHLRAMATALCGAFGRVGALIGNSLFGYLIDNYCITLILIIAAQLLACSVLGIFIPLEKKNKNVDTSTEKISTP
ncbi:hypothetical protein PV327_001769 [Microctonus hyperodae]|uniref:Major facilitator superfamily (MFS) profile domain-containing protein n=1 Tax=Microctonus hyperodae TaxID=165561 RepID=A0AA39FE97_MICHY|nr:hypothetical protein PV327_001769 [Microctonus hyperodae]